MTALDCAWSAFNAALDRYPYDAMHPARIEAREHLWRIQHVWVDTPLDEWTPY
jgi:hypothetical protein